MKMLPVNLPGSIFLQSIVFTNSLQYLVLHFSHLIVDNLIGKVQHRKT